MRTGWTGRTGWSDLKGTTLVAVAVAAGSLALTGCQKVEGKVDAPARPVKVHSVVPAAQESRIRYSATIRADEEVAVAFKSAGYIETVVGRRGADGRLHTLQPGDFVQAGETIARIRDAEYREHVNRAAGSVREAEAALAKARLDLERARGLFAAQSLTRPELDAAESAFESGERAWRPPARSCRSRRSRCATARSSHRCPASCSSAAWRLACWPAPAPLDS